MRSRFAIILFALLLPRTVLAQSPTPGPVPSYRLFQNNGTTITQRATANFFGGLQTVDNVGLLRSDVSIATGGVTNLMLQNPSLTINTTGPIAGGGTVALGSSLTISCPSCVTSLPTIYYQTVQANSVDQTQEAKLNFASTFAVTTTAPSTSVDVASGAITNTMLQHPSFVVTTASPLGGAGTISLGGTLALTCTGCLTQAYTTIKNSAGTAQTQRSNLKFGSDFIVADATPDTTVALAANSVTVNTTSPIGGGATLSLGGTMTLTCTSCITGTPSAAGDIIYSTAGSQGMTALADVAAGSYLRSGGVATAPLWSTLTLPNAATTGDVLYASSANTIGRLADVAVNQALLSGGIGAAPTYGTVPNAALTNSTIGVLAGTGLSGGGTPALGSSATINMPNTGPGAGLIGGSGIASVTLDAQGRVTAAATATYLTSAFYQTIKNSVGTAQTQRANLKFGADFSVSDSSPDTVVALAANSLTVNTSSPLGGGGSVALGGTLTLTCTSCLTGTPTTTGDVMYSTAGGQAMTPLHPVAAGSYIRSAGTAAAPVWSTLTLPNAATTGDLLSASGTNAVGVIAAVATGSFLRSAGTSTLPAWSTTTLPNSATTGDVLYASTSNVYSNLADVAAGSFLRSGGTSTAPAWSTTTWPNAATAGDLIYASSTNTIGSLADVAVNKVLLSGGIGVVPAWGTVANAALTNSSVTVTAGTGLAGGGSVALGSSVSLNLPNVGPGAGTIGGGGTLIVSVTLDAQGRVTAATTGTATGTGTVTSVAANNGLTGGTITTSGTLSIGGTDDTTFSTGSMSWSGAAAKTVALTKGAASSGSAVGFTFTGAADTGLTASTEVSDLNLNFAQTKQHAAGALTTQRAVVVQAPTYSFASASTITNAATFAITGAPVAGTSATITNTYALWTQAGVAHFDTSSIGTAQTVGGSFHNPTAAANNAQQFSPVLELISEGWGTTASASQIDKWGLQTQSVQGAVASANLVFMDSINGGAYTSEVILTANGPNVVGGYSFTGPTGGMGYYDGNSTGIFGSNANLLFIVNNGRTVDLSATSMRSSTDGGIALGNNTQRWLGLYNSGPNGGKFRNTTSTVTVAASDWWVGVGGSGARTVNLPAANTLYAGQEIVIQETAGNGSGNTITINRASTDTINGATSITIATGFGRKTLVSNGSNAWFASSATN